MDAFKTQKEIIEHKIPKILALFESIFTCASKIRGETLENFSLSKVIRFYETGVKSYFGEQLVEFGFPVDAIKRIEDNNNNKTADSRPAATPYKPQQAFGMLSDLTHLLCEFFGWLFYLH